VAVNTDELTLAQALDRLAELEYSLTAKECASLRELGHPPIPATLDAVAGMMPEGWAFDLLQFDGTWVLVTASKIGGTPATIGATADTELLARARLAVKVREAMTACTTPPPGVAQ
jgi:hypothetical protein